MKNRNTLHTLHPIHELMLFVLVLNARLTPKTKQSNMQMTWFWGCRGCSLFLQRNFLNEDDDEDDDDNDETWRGVHQHSRFLWKTQQQESEHQNGRQGDVPPTHVSSCETRHGSSYNSSSWSWNHTWFYSGFTPTNTTFRLPSSPCGLPFRRGTPLAPGAVVNRLRRQFGLNVHGIFGPRLQFFMVYQHEGLVNQKGMNGILSRNKWRTG